MAANDRWGIFCLDMITFLSSNKDAKNEVIKDICRRNNDMSAQELESWIYKHPQYKIEFEHILDKHKQTELLQRIRSIASALERSGKKIATSLNAPKVLQTNIGNVEEDSTSKSSDIYWNTNDNNTSQQVEEVCEQKKQRGDIGADSDHERSASVGHHGEELSELAEQIRKCEETFSHITEEVGKLKEQILTKDTEIAKLMEECDQLKVEGQSMIDIIREKDKEIVVLETERDQLKMQLNELEKKVNERRNSKICSIQ